MQTRQRSIRNLAAETLLSVCIIGITQGGSAAPLISTFAGTGAAGYSGEGGVATGAQLNNPYGIARGPDGALYICDMENHRVRRVSRDGTITTAAGKGKPGHSPDGWTPFPPALNATHEVA